MADETAKTALIIDASGAKRGAEEFAAAGRKVIDANQEIVASTERVATSFSSQQRVLNRYAREFDPFNQAVREATKRVEDLQRISQGQGEAAVRAANQLAAAQQRLAQTQRDLAQAQRLGVTTREGLAEQERMIAAAQRYRDVLNPLLPLQRQYREELAEINRLAKAGTLTETERAATIQRTKDAFAAQVTALRAGSGALTEHGKAAGLSANQISNLTFQLNDLVVSLAGGMNPLMVFMQQGSQITPIFGGVRATLAAAAAALTPLRVGLAATAAVAGTVALRIIDLQAEARGFTVTMQAMGRGAEVTTRQLHDLVEAQRRAGVGRDDARASVDTFARAGALNPQQISRLSGLAPDFAAATRNTAEGATRALVDMGTKGFESIMKLDAAYGFLTLAESTQIEQLTRLGKQTEALAIATGAMERQFQDAAKTARGPFAQAVLDLGNSFHRLVDAVAENPIAKFAASATEFVASKVLDAITWQINLYARAIEAVNEGIERFRRLVQTGDINQLRTPSAVDPALGAGDDRLTQQQAKRAQQIEEASRRRIAVMTAEIGLRDEMRARMEAENEIQAGNLKGLEAAAVMHTKVAEALAQRTATTNDAILTANLEAAAQTRVAQAYQSSAKFGLRVEEQQRAMIEAATGQIERSRALEVAQARSSAAAASALADLSRGLPALQAQADAQGRLAAAAGISTQALSDMEIQNKATAVTADAMNKALAAGSAEQVAAVQEAYKAYLAFFTLIRDGERQIQFAQDSRQADRDLQISAMQAQAAAITSPETRRAMEMAVERQQKMNELTTRFGDDWVKINELIGKFDLTANYREVARFYDDVRRKAEDISKDISQFLIDGFVNAEKGGKSAFQNLWDGAVAGAKRMLANIAAEFLRTKLILPIVSQIVGGMPGLAGIATPQTSGGGVMINGQSFVPAGQQSIGPGGVSLPMPSLGGGQGGLFGDFMNTPISSIFSGGASATSTIPTNMATYGGLMEGGYTTGTATASAAGLGSSSTGAVSSAAGGMTVGAGFGAAGLGFMAGSMVGGMMENSGSGALAGAAAGALAGTMVMPGIGTAIGAVLGAIGGALSGKNKNPAKQSSVGGMIDESGQIGWEEPRSKNFSTDGVLGQRRAMQQFVTTISRDYGVSFAGQGVAVGLGREGGQFYTTGGGEAQVEFGYTDDQGQRDAMAKLAATLLRRGYLAEDATAAAGGTVAERTASQKDVRTAIRTIDIDQITEATFDKWMTFARDFRDNLAELTAGGRDFEQTVGRKARDEIRGTVAAIRDFKDQTAQLGLDSAAAAAATRSNVEIFAGIKDAAPPLTATQKALALLQAKFEALPALLEEVGYSAADAVRVAQEQLQAARDELTGNVLTGFWGTMERLRAGDPNWAATPEVDARERGRVAATGLRDFLTDTRAVFGNDSNEMAQATGSVEEFLQVFLGFADAKPVASAFAQGVRDINAAMQGAEPALREMGVTTDEIWRSIAIQVDRLRQQAEQQVGLAAATLASPGAAAAATRIREFNAAIAEVRERGGDEAAVRRLWSLRDAQVALNEERQNELSTIQTTISTLQSQIGTWNGLASAMRQAREGFLTDQNLSTLNPLDRLNEARRQAVEAASLARAGDAEAGNRLPELVRSLYENSRAYNASGAGYVQDFDLGQQLLRDTQTYAERQIQVAEQQLSVAQESSRQLGYIERNTNPSGPLWGGMGGIDPYSAEAQLGMSIRQRDILLASMGYRGEDAGKGGRERFIGATAERLADYTQRILQAQAGGGLFGGGIPAGVNVQLAEQQLGISLAQRDEILFQLGYRGENAGAGGRETFINRHKADYLSLLREARGYADGGMIEAGQIARIHSNELLYTGPGARVFNPADTARILGGSNDNGLMMREMTGAFGRFARNQEAAMAHSGRAFQAMLDRLAAMESELRQVRNTLQLAA